MVHSATQSMKTLSASRIDQLEANSKTMNDATLSLHNRAFRENHTARTSLSPNNLTAV